MPRQIKAGLFLGLFGLAVGYILATSYLSFRFNEDYSYTYFALNWQSVQRIDQDIFVHALLIMFGVAGVGVAIGAQSASQALTKVGKTNWQTTFQMRWNKLLGKPGQGFVVAKTSLPRWPGKYITYEEKPHCIVIAPSGEGKGVGFVYPNLFTFEGSTVTLDIKGENYDTTARWRHKMGSKVFLFAPVEFDELSHRYNPLDRIGRLENPAEWQLELEQIAGLFLQGEANLETWLEGAREFFFAAAGIAHQRGTFTLGGIYDVCVGSQSTIKEYLAKLRDEARDEDLQKELNKLAVLEEKTLSGYLSIMMTAGFKQWKNAQIRKMTDVSDFSFDDIRRKQMSVYFKVSEPKLKVIAPLVRLFFNELVATMQSRMPGTDEPHKVMIILDEFQALGRMDTVADAMATIRGFGGRIAIITQTIPQLDDVYDQNRRLVIQGNAGLKLYMTPSDERTVEDVSNACGMTTRKVVSSSQRQGIGEKKTFSERTEEVPLLSKDAARQMKSTMAVIIVNGMPPIQAYRIRHFKDRTFFKILKTSQSLPWEPITNELLKLRVIEGGRAAPPAALPAPVGSETIDVDLEAFPAEPSLVPVEDRRPTTEDEDTVDSLIDRLFELIGDGEMLPEQRALYDAASKLVADFPVSMDSPKSFNGSGNADQNESTLDDPFAPMAKANNVMASLDESGTSKTHRKPVTRRKRATLKKTERLGLELIGNSA